MRPIAPQASRTAWFVAVAVAGLVVFFCHFRPWEVGLLEEWGLADTWNRLGWSAFGDSAGFDIGRPFHKGLFFVALSAGLGITGIQALLGIVALGQFVLVLRFGPESGGARRWLSLVLAVTIALHPLWPAGFILRYLGAQVAVLATIAALSLLYRFLRGGRAWLLVASAVVAGAGLLTYQATAAVLPLIAVALSAVLTSASRRRRVVASVVTIATVAVSLLWSAVISPKLAPGGATYESALLGGTGGGGIAHTLKTIALSIGQIPVTLAIRAPAVVVVAVLLLLLLVLFHRRLGSTVRVALVLSAVSVLALVAGAPYAVNPLHVVDPERVGGPAALTLGLVALLWFLLSPPPSARLQVAAAIVLLVATTVATAASLSAWARYSTIQRSMLDLIAPAVDEAKGSELVLIADGSGILGDVYTGYEPDLAPSSHVYHGDPTDVVMCTMDGVVKVHPVAAIFPLTTTEYCSSFPIPADARLITQGEIAGGPVDVYIIDAAKE